MKKNILFLGFFALTSLLSCKENLSVKDYTGKPILDSSYTTSNSNTAQIKNVLIEEYTGVRCQNCPDGHIKLEELATKYGDKIIAIGLHNNSLADPYDNDQDFRIPEADALAAEFGVSPKPAAVIDRTKDNNNTYAYNRLKWEEVTDLEILKTTKVNITPSVRFNTQLNDYILSGKIEFTQSYSNKASVTMVLIENNIKATQLNGSDHDENYIHKHVLRKIYTNTLGNSLTRSSSSYEKGKTYLLEYLLNKKAIWNTDNCYLVVFVTDDVTKEVLQAAEVKLK